MDGTIGGLFVEGKRFARVKVARDIERDLEYLPPKINGDLVSSRLKDTGTIALKILDAAVLGVNLSVLLRERFYLVDDGCRPGQVEIAVETPEDRERLGTKFLVGNHNPATMSGRLFEEYPMEEAPVSHRFEQTVRPSSIEDIIFLLKKVFDQIGLQLKVV
jgi:hypothetical protein